MVDCSVIIPHYNQIESLKRCLDRLAIQKVQDISYEILVVDNGSKINPKDELNGYNIRLFKVENPKNPYACRNFGISNAKASIICFLDSKCLPCSTWIQSGYDFMQKNSCSLVGGIYDIKPGLNNSSKVFPLMYLNTLKNVKNNYGVSCGNMFVKRQVFNKIGLFETSSISGNDILFCKKAQNNNFIIGCSENSIVQYPPKRMTDLLSDIIKYGYGSLLTGQKTGLSIFSYLMPMRIKTLRESMSNRDYSMTFFEKIHIWFLIWFAKVHFAFGMIKAMIKRSVS